MIINHILMVSQGSKAGTLPPCWDLGTLGTPCEPALRATIQELNKQN